MNEYRDAQFCSMFVCMLLCTVYMQTYIDASNWPPSMKCWSLLLKYVSTVTILTWLKWWCVCGGGGGGEVNRLYFSNA